MVEIDVRLTKDKIPVLSHDDSLKRISGKKILISRSSLERLKNIRLKNDERIATLDEALDVAKGRISILLDIKVQGMERKVVESISERKIRDSVIVSSVNLNVLKKIKKIDPRLRTALIFRFLKSSVIRAKRLGCYSVHPHHLGATKKLIKFAKKHKLKVHPFTVDNSKRMRKLVSQGVDGIITNKPVLLRNVLFDMNSPSK